MPAVAPATEHVDGFPVQPAGAFEAVQLSEASNISCTW
jgi:hypothetical protein